MLSPKLVNARIYGTDYVVVVSPVNGAIPMSDVRHTYLHYMIEPLLYARANAIDRTQPILKEIRDAPLEFRYPLRHRGADRGVPHQGHRGAHHGYRRSRSTRFPRAWSDRTCRAMSTSARSTSRRWMRSAWATVHHDMTQGFVLTQYFYEQLIQFEKDPASLRDTIGEMVYSMDVDQQVHRARQIRIRQAGRRRCAAAQQAARADRSRPGGGAACGRRCGDGQRDGAPGAHGALRHAGGGGRCRARQLHPGPRGHYDRPSRKRRSIDSRRRWPPARSRACWPGRISTWAGCSTWIASATRPSRNTRKLWPRAMGQQDTRLAAERGVKAAYAVNGHSCEDADEDDSGAAPPEIASTGTADRARQNLSNRGQDCAV